MDAGRGIGTGIGTGTAGTTGTGAGGMAIVTLPGSALQSGPVLRLANYEFVNSLHDLLGVTVDAPLEPDAPSTGDFRIGGPAGDNTVSTYHAAAISIAATALKTLATVDDLCRRLAAWGLLRNDAIVALGGGVVGDTAGFVAPCTTAGSRSCRRRRHCSHRSTPPSAARPRSTSLRARTSSARSTNRSASTPT